MKKALNDIKSFVTVVFTLACIYALVVNKIDGEKFYNLYLIIISFYFGTQYEKNK